MTTLLGVYSHAQLKKAKRYYRAVGDCVLVLTTVVFARRAFISLTSVTCPLWVKSRHMRCKSQCPLYPQ